jgi:EAL domain-containing protein (putative c-di-GMP-specific phosphodiesterase class I)
LALSEFLLQSIEKSDSTNEASLRRLLSAIRQHLDMDVAFISEFSHGRRIFRHVDSSHPNNPCQAGEGDPLEESYCQRVVDGRLPELMQDARQNPVAAELPVTFALPVGAHLSVPIRLDDGSIYGTFCCFRFTPDRSLDERDLNMMRVFSDVAAKLIESEREASARHHALLERIMRAIERDELSMVYQPIFDLHKNHVTGFEALSRFHPEPYRTPDTWFHDADQVGMGLQLETKAIHLALEALVHLPENVYVSVNLSPQHILHGALETLFEDKLLNRVVLEITEHAVVNCYDDLANRIRPFRGRGLRIAVDDAGAGYASFRHILKLAPDRIKLDTSLTQQIDTDGSRRALAAAFSRFSEEIGTEIVAEGAETQTEIQTLLDLGISKVQGFYLGRPMSLQEAVKIFH